MGGDGVALKQAKGLDAVQAGDELVAGPVWADGDWVDKATGGNLVAQAADGVGIGGQAGVGRVRYVNEGQGDRLVRRGV